jgi:hypothetical protein
MATEQYGKLTIVADLGLRQHYDHRQRYVRVKCNCGTEFDALKTVVTRGVKKSCGCLRNKSGYALDGRLKIARRQPLLATGTRFGKLTVVSDNGAAIVGHRTRTVVEAICDCGKTKIFSRTYLINGKVKSCGCLRVDTGSALGKMGYNLKAPGEASFNATYSAYRKRAREKSLAFELDQDQFRALTSAICFYCERPPSNVGKNGYNGVYVYNGIDRLDSSKGYTPTNTVPCCEICNRAKSNLSVVEFTDWLNALRRPRGHLCVSGITDSYGKKISTEQAVKYGWLKFDHAALVAQNNHEQGFKNIFTDQGRQLLAYLFGARSPVTSFACSKFSVGTGVTAASASDVALEAPITLSTGSTLGNVESIDYLTAFVVRVSFTLGLTDANGYLINEEGLYSGNGSLIARRVRSVGINKTSDFAPTLTWRLRF